TIRMAAFGFTPASGQDVFSFEIRPSSSKITSSPLSGSEARVFYENLTKDDDKKELGKKDGDVKQRKRGSSRRERRRSRTAEMQQSRTGPDPHRGRAGESEGSSRGSSMLQGLRLLRCAHEGDIPGLKDLLSKGVDINFQDSFFWTAVMCASWSGQRAAVRLLLQHGAAWVGVVDTQGRDAKDLAQEGIPHQLKSHHFERSGFHLTTALQPQWCEVCRSEHSDSLTSHLSSTLHQFSLRRPPPTPYYCLPPSSNSYRMMVRSGWNPGSGLGPEGEGTKQPVPTVLKRDQTGLGYGQTKRAKVTHFQARDCDAVKQPSRVKEERVHRGKKKEESQRKEQRDKNWERDFRTSFYL
uniref:G-patch domain-containing protein n=1 Tax=Salarias fasciatus TaxID=181472 RepID=A0A672F7X4_SALFA